MTTKLILKNWQSPGDLMMLTAAIRDLHNAHPGKYEVKLNTSCKEIFENNPYLSDFPDSEVDQVIRADYPLIHQSNQKPFHFIHGFRDDLEKKLNIQIPQGDFKPEIYISDQERSWMSQVAELGYKKRFWILMAGGKYDYTAKWWNPTFYQEVVDHFKGKIVFAQCGEKSHFHPPMEGTINLIGKTNLRQYIRLMYHSIGVVCPVTFAMHLSVGTPNPHGLKNRPTVVLAGGREPAQWEQYPHHRFLSNNGALPCCDNGGCWKSRCTPVGDGDSKDQKELCIYPEDTGFKGVVNGVEKTVHVPKCLNMIKPKHVIEAIESHYEGGVLTYEKFSERELKELWAIMEESHNPKPKEAAKPTEAPKPKKRGRPKKEAKTPVVKKAPVVKKPRGRPKKNEK
tara:strand:+ start:16348 stop:17538 length:1191 start_codon:yes stop_codon:yes gene_type:complete